MGDGADGAAEVLVANEETVCRVGFAADVPIARHGGFPEKHDPDTGLIRLEEITWDDLKTNGFSLQIKRLYSLAEAQAEAQRRNSEKSQKLGANANYRVAGCHFVEVKAVHAITDSQGQKMFRVLDTHTEQEPAHAEIRIADHLPKSGLLKYRLSLRDALGPIQDAALIDQ